MNIHAQRSAAHHRGLKFQRVRRVYDVLSYEWKSIPEIIESLLADQGIRLSATTIKKYVWQGDFDKLNLAIEVDQKHWQLRAKE